MVDQVINQHIQYHLDYITTKKVFVVALVDLVPSYSYFKPIKNLIIDLSCRKTNKGWAVATNRWQTITNTLIDEHLLESLSKSCREFLVHAADVEGLQSGMDVELIEFLSQYSPIPCTYAGGASSRNDLELINDVSAGKIDLTIGSALDIFGGSKILFSDCVRWNECGHF